MRDLVILFVHLLVTVARLARPGGLRSVVAESTLVRHQLLVLNRGCKRAPNLRAADRIIAGLCTFFMRRASESSGARGDCFLRAAFASLRRATDRYGSA